jgi:uncharacterized phage-associated protein
MVTTTRATAKQVAEYFLLVVDEDPGDVMTNLRLQKLVCYAQAWHLAILDEELFDDDCETWVHGPVIHDLYKAYEGFNWNPIPRPTSEPNLPVNERSREILDDVWDTYGQFSAKGLENIVRDEDPWTDARRGCGSGDFCREVISKDAMRAYYAEQRRRA